MVSDLIVLRLERARQALILARTAIEAKQVADLAQAAKIVAIKQRAREAAQQCHELAIDALTLEGDFLRAAPKNNGKLKRGPVVPEENHGTPPTLVEQGITKRESSQAQALAELTEQAPQEHERVRQGKRTVNLGIQVVRWQKRQAAFDARAAEAPPLDENSCRIITGDCLAQRSAVEPGTARQVVLDPPYNEGVNYGRG